MTPAYSTLLPEAQNTPANWLVSPAEWSPDASGIVGSGTLVAELGVRYQIW